MNFKKEPVYLSILNKVEKFEETYVINTLCERTTLFESDKDMCFPIFSSAKHLIRFLDNRVQLPLDEIFDPDELSEEDLSEENIELLEAEDEEESWEDYPKDHPVETSRQFLSTNHFNDCTNVFTMIKREQKPVLRRPILAFFSKREQAILKEKSVKINDVKFDDVKKIDSKPNLSTSFLKSYSNEHNSLYSDENEEFSLDANLVRKQLHSMGFKNNHTGFAIGSVPKNIGILEYDGMESKNELKHVSFWEFRESYDKYQLAKYFSFYDMIV